MSKREIYKEGDFVNYVGNYNTSYVHKNIAQIDSIEKTDSYWKLQITVLEPTEKVFCLNDLVRPIFTEKENLLNLDFQEESNPKKQSVFRIEQLIVSGLNLYIPEMRLNFNTGYCVGDLRNMTIEEFKKNYVKSDEIDFDSLHNDYPSVSNINDLAYEYSKYFNFNINRIFR